MFLFVGLIGTASVLFQHSPNDNQIVLAQSTEKKDSRLTIKEIESISSYNNYSFTSINALR